MNNFPCGGFHASAAIATYGAVSGVDGHSIARAEDARAVTIGDSSTSFRSRKRLHQERCPIARARGGFKNFCRHADPLTPDVQQEARVSNETASMFLGIAVEFERTDLILIYPSVKRTEA